MIYLLYGTQELILKRRLEKILKENFEVLDDFNFIKIDAKEVIAEDIAYEASLQSIGYDRKAVVVYNPYFLSTEREKVKFDREPNFAMLVDYINNPNESTDLFFIANYPKLNEKNEVVKALKVHANILEARDITPAEWPSFAKKYFDKLDVQIDIDAITELVNRIENDATRFVNEAEKLALYSSHITKKDVEMLVSRPLDANAFGIFDNLIHGNNKGAIRIYRDLLVEAEEPVKLISLISTQFRLLAQTYSLAREGLTQKEIASELKIHEYRVKLALDNSRFIKYGKVMKTLNDLYNLDYAIKSGEAPDRFFAFEMFLINFNALD